MIQRKNADGSTTVASSPAAMAALDGVRASPRNAREWAAQLRADPSVSYWLKDALAVLFERDCLDARNDSELLARVMQRYASECLHAGAEALGFDLGEGA